MKAAVLGANSALGRRIVLQAEAAGIAVTSVVSAPTDLVGNGPIIIKEPEELTAQELSRFHVVIDALSFPLITRWSEGQTPLERIEAALRESGAAYVAVGDCSLLYTDSSRQELIADSGFLAGASGSSDPQRCKKLYQHLQDLKDLKWTLLCPPLVLDAHAYGRGRFELTDDVLPMGLDGSSRIALSDFVSALIELLKVRGHLQRCASVRGL